MTGRLLAAAGLLASIAFANWLTGHYGLVPAGFGLLVTAGTYSAGLALALRDVVHESGGIRWVLGTIAAGCVLSLLLADGRIALASAAAFGLAELLDLAVYAPLRRRHWRFAVTASNAVGAVVDTLVFLAIAGFPLTAGLVGGQILVKAVWVTTGFLAAAEALRRATAHRRAASA
jgi:uncharacterized PurR-regulated membrane protein YhhQ (DUF165 family)